ncbi:DUF5677 domain-containing protein [Microbacterium aurum]
MNQRRPNDDALVEWIRYVEEALRRPEFTIRPEFATDFEVLYGVILQSARYGIAFLRLREAGLHREGEALARAAMEHAITAHWVFFTEGGRDRFAVQINTDFRRYYKVMAEWLEDATLRQEVEEVSEYSGKGMPTFTQILSDFGGSFLRTAYKSLSLSVHPTHHTVLRYLEHTDAGVEVRIEARDANSFPALYLTAISSMLALSLVEFMIDPSRAEELLDEASERLRLPMFIHSELPEAKRRAI